MGRWGQAAGMCAHLHVGVDHAAAELGCGVQICGAAALHRPGRRARVKLVESLEAAHTPALVQPVASACAADLLLTTLQHRSGRYYPR